MTLPDRPVIRSELGSEYGRLLAERDRLISEGVDPDELEMPLPPPMDPDPLYVLDDDIALFHGHHPACPYTIEGDWTLCRCGAFLGEGREELAHHSHLGAIVIVAAGLVILAVALFAAGFRP
jgi:hypothetical protein